MVHRFYGCARRSTWHISGFHSGDLVLSDPSEHSAECRIFYQLPHSFNDRFTAVRIHENCPHRSQLPGVSPRLTRCPQHPKVGIPGTHRNSCQFDGTAESLRMQLFLIQAAAWPYPQDFSGRCDPFPGNTSWGYPTAASPIWARCEARSLFLI